jgi:hypothetical protein
MLILSPPPQVRIHWVYDDPSGVPELLLHRVL